MAVIALRTAPIAEPLAISRQRLAAEARHREQKALQSDTTPLRAMVTALHSAPDPKLLAALQIIMMPPYLNTPQSSAGEVSVGRRGAERQITNVAAGVEDTDAVNVAQLRGAVDYITQDIDRVFGDIHRLGIEIDAAKDLARAAGAIGLAASQIRYDDRPGKVSLGVGVGSFSGQNALTVGLGYTSQDLTWRANVSGGVAGSETGIGAGISFTLN